MIELMPGAVLQTRMTQASRDGRTYFGRSRESLNAPPLELTEGCSISLSASLACAPVRDRCREARACSLRPRRKSHLGDSATNRLPPRNKMPGGIDIQKMRRQAW